MALHNHRQPRVRDSERRPGEVCIVGILGPLHAIGTSWVYSRQEDDGGLALNVTEPIVCHDAQIDDDKSRVQYLFP
jgi:hypothetical protein